MSKTEQAKYDKYLETFAVSESEIFTARYKGELEGREKGREKGREEGREENKIDVVIKAFHEGFSIPSIAKITESSEKWVKSILAKKGHL